MARELRGCCGVGVDETIGASETAVIATEAQLAAYVWDTFNVRIPNVRVCPHHSTPWEAFCYGYFVPARRVDEARMMVIKGSRGFAGKSTLLALLGTTIATTLKSDVVILGGSAAQSKVVHRAMSKFWSSPNAPREMLATDPGMMETRFRDGQEIRALTASQASIRGPHPLALLLDEVDEMDLAIFDGAMGQTLDQHGHLARTVVSSTHQYDDGTMTEVLKRAKDRGWRVFEWCWKETLEPHGWLSASQVARKRAEMTEAMWQVEVELQEPDPGGRAIATAMVDRLFSGTVIQAPEGMDGDFPYQEFERPVEGAAYAHGFDWAATRDYVEGVTWRHDIFPLRLVAYQRFRRKPAHYTVAQFRHQTTRYPGVAWHDATSFGGKTMDDLVGDNVSVRGFTMSPQPRRELFSNYVLAIEHEELVAPRIEPLYRQHRQCRNDDLFGGGHPPDGVVAGALGYGAAGLTRGEPLRVMRPQDFIPGAETSSEPIFGLARALADFGRR